MRPLVLALLLALGGHALRAEEVTVFAAASLTDALQTIAAAYERTSGDRIVFNFGASSVLARQIDLGAPADLFLSADEAKMDALAAKKRIDPRTRVSVLSNTLVIVVPRDSRQTIRAPRDLLRVRSLAVAEPSSVPAGIYAKAYLTKLGLWTALAPKLVPAENVRGALAAVASGNVDAGIVYRTDAAISKDVRVAYEVPRAQGPAISYPFAVTTDAEHPAAARRFLAYLRSKEAARVFARYGFVVR